MWAMILFYFCCKRGRGPKLSPEEKRKKWFRLVAVMTIRSYGTQVISRFFYTFLIAEALISTTSIWKDFREYSDCNNEYTANVTTLVSEQYSEAADQLAASVVQRTACLTSVADVPLAGFHIGIGDAFDATFGDVFGWFSPGQGTIPKADLDLETNTDAVMRKVADDLQFLRLVAFILRISGFVLAGWAIVVILLKATFYTVENLPWKPGVLGLTMRIFEALRVVAAYCVLMGAVYLQAYIIGKSCDVNLNNTVIRTPMCEVVGDECKFKCVIFEQNFTSPCTECDIHYRKWWEEPRSWPNILGVAYIICIFFILFLELGEGKRQKAELRAAEQREKEERERERQEKAERKKHRKKKTSKYQPPVEQTMDADETRIQVESDDYEEKRRRKKSSSSDRPKSSSAIKRYERRSKTRFERNSSRASSSYRL